MNNIAKKQNEDTFLKFQYSARYFYNRAEFINYLVWILCVLTIIINNISLPFPNNIIKNCIAFFIALTSFYLENKVTEYVKIAAAMRKYVDYHLFNFEIPNKYNGYSKDYLTEIVSRVVSKNPKKAAEQMENSGTDHPPGVKDWYTGINPDDDITIAILECQKQNAFWDRELSNKYICISRTIIVILGIIFLFVFLKKTLLDAISFILFLSPLILKAIKEYRAIKKYKDISKSLTELLNMPSTLLTKELLLIIQEKIDQRRLLTFITPNLLHMFSNIKLHSIVNQKRIINQNRDTSKYT